MENISQWTVVLIDDEEGIRKVTRITLEDSGYAVHTAENGKIGIEMCARYSPQIVITDIRMPEMDGIKVLETIKKRFPDTEVIVVTAFGEMELAIKALQLDASDFITKPLHDDALHVAMERAKDRYISKKRLKDYTAFLEDGWTKTTQELMEAFSFQKNLIECSMDGIVGCNSREIIATFNKSMEQLLGYSKREVINRMKFGDLFLPEEEKRIKDEIANEKYGGKDRLFMFETMLRGKNSTRIPVQVSASVIYNHEKKDGLVCFFRDLSKIKKLEREVEDQAKILYQDKMMSLGRLASSVVHEINNPLAGILNYCRLMIKILSRGKITDEYIEKFSNYLNVIEKETARCSQIVSSLLTFSRKPDIEFENVSVEELVKRCIILSRHKLELSNIKLETKVPCDIPDIKGNYNQLQQCIINLIFNAIDAMPQGGTLKVEAGYNPSDRIVTISVSDTGTGIDEKDLPHIFEPFFTTKDEGYGVGLGLSTLYGIIEHHNGMVDVDSKKGTGTTFYLRFKI